MSVRGVLPVALMVVIAGAHAFAADAGVSAAQTESSPSSADAGVAASDANSADPGPSTAHAGHASRAADAGHDAANVTPPPDAPLADAPLVSAPPVDAGVPGAPVPGTAVLAEPTPRLGEKHFLVPALEALSFDLSLFAFNNLVSRMPFALVSWDDIGSHFDGRNGWVFDVDYFVTNQFGHPYQGAIVHTAARSSGLSFWESTLYTFFSSLAWEYLFEKDAPSINDQITTTLGGVLLGEVLHRTYRFLVDGSAGTPTWYSIAAATLISPASALNRWLFDDDVDHSSIETRPPFHARIETGVSLATRFASANGQERTFITQGAQLILAAELLYGAPSDTSWRYRAPFSHFDVNVNITLPGIPSANLYVRGLLLGGQFGAPSSITRGLWGLFGLYDFGANNIVRVSSVGLGFGTTIDSRLGEAVFFRGTAIAGALGFAAAGTLGLDPEKDRDYHIGPGVQGILEGRLILLKRWELAMNARIWGVNGAYLDASQGYETIVYLTASTRVRLTKRLAVGMELPLSTRVYGFGPEQRGAAFAGSFRLMLSYMSDDEFGTRGWP